MTTNMRRLGLLLALDGRALALLTFVLGGFWFIVCSLGFLFGFGLGCFVSFGLLCRLGGICLL